MFAEPANVSVYAEGILKKQIDFIDRFFIFVNKKGLRLLWHDMCRPVATDRICSSRAHENVTHRSLVVFDPVF